jgi:hypothetical protein
MIPIDHRLPQVHGPTPEFVRWSIDYRCPIREPIDTTLVEKTERYLWSLAAIGECLSRGNIVDDVCVVTSELEAQPARGCFVREIAAFYGGLEFCQNQCGGCAANIPPLDFVGEATSNQSLAGCFGWLIRNERMVKRLDEMIGTNREEISSMGIFRLTNPAWYGLWSADKLEGRALEFVGRIFDQIIQRESAPADWQRFRKALAQCRARNWSLSVELVPAGSAEGSCWTIGPYCPDCRAPMNLGIRQCDCCGRNGLGHPAHNRKVIGQRPFSRLDSLVGPERAQRLLSRLAEVGGRLNSRSRGAEANHP